MLRDSGGDDTGNYMTRIFLGNDTINIFGCHFASNNYTADKHYMPPDSIKGHHDITIYVDDIKKSYNRRIYEVEILIEEIGPVIAMGDFNDVGGSKCIKNLEAIGLKDAWWEGGCGYGATIHKPLPYRIDHVMYTKDLKLNRIKLVDSQGVSDHDALYAEFEY